MLYIVQLHKALLHDYIYYTIYVLINYIEFHIIYFFYIATKL